MARSQPDRRETRDGREDPSGEPQQRDIPDSAGTVDLLVVGPTDADTGGVAQYLDEQCRRLPADVAVRDHDNGARTDLLGGGRLGVALAGLLAALRFPLRQPPDVVHVHTSHGSAFYRAVWYVLVTALLWDRPVVVHVHGSSFDEFVDAGGIAARLQRLTFGLSDRVIVLSPYWSDVLSRRVSTGKIDILPNAVDPDEYDPSFGADPPHVAFVSNLIERKGVPELVAAVERLAGADREFRVTVAGRGPLSGRVEALADRYDVVEYRGYVPEDEKRALLDGASVYVLPTHAEGLPIALLEGMAAGNAVVTTDVGSIPEVVDDDMGRVVSPGDVDALVDALAELLDDPETVATMGRRNRERVVEEYSWSRIADRLTETYRSLVATDGR